MSTLPVSKISRTGIKVPFHECVEKKEPANDKKRPRSDEDSLPVPSIVEKSLVKPPLRVVSVPTFASLDRTEHSLPLKKRLKRSQSSILAPVQVFEVPVVDSFEPQRKPETFLQSILQRSTIPGENLPFDPSNFVPIEKQQHDSYAAAAMAARNEDLFALRKLHENGKNLQCSNKFGESIVHIVCRRGRDDILDFLVSEAGVTLRIRDDFGRTPLHDAAWTERPNFRLVRLLLAVEPDLIFVRDNRGNSPLAYVPRQNWGIWNSFLNHNKDFFQSTASKRSRHT